MIISTRMTHPIWVFFTKRRFTKIFLAITRILNPRCSGIKIPEPKKQMLGTMEPPCGLRSVMLFI